MPDPYAPHLIAEIRTHGVTDYRIEPGGKHNKLVFTWRGRTLSCVFPVSPSDQRGLLNALEGLRRLMGVRRVITRKSTRGPKRRAARPVPAMPREFTVRGDPWAVLRGMVSDG